MSDPTGSLPHPASSRERAVSKTFVMLADTLVDDFDVVDLLDRLAHICVDLLDVTAAGLLLRDQKGSLTVVASSSEETRLLEVCQLQSDEGPCLDCVRSGAPVVSVDLAADSERWPVFAAAARDAGLVAVTAVPMRLRNETIGALNLFHDHDRAITEADQELAQAFADVATVGILQQRLAHRSSLLTEQLQQALNSRVLIEQAKGVLTERHGISMDEAFAALRSHARDHNLKIADAALAVVRSTSDIVPDPARGNDVGKRK